MAPTQRRSMVQSFVATAVISGFIGVVGWQVWSTGTLDADLKQTLIAGFFVVIGYYLGSSEGSRRKTEMMGELEELPLIPPAPP